MNDQYYGREDVPDMSNPATAVELFQSQREGLPEITFNNVALDDIEAMLGTLWHESEAAMGAAQTDEQKARLANRQNQLVAVWEKAKGIQANAVQYFATLGSGAAAIEAVQDQLEKVAGELDALLQAIEDHDMNHPQVESLIQGVRDDAYGDGFSEGRDAYHAGDYVDDRDTSITKDDYEDEVTNHLTRWGNINGISWYRKDTETLMELWSGDEYPNEVMRDLLLAVMRRITDERHALYESGAA